MMKGAQSKDLLRDRAEVGAGLRPGKLPSHPTVLFDMVPGYMNDGPVEVGHACLAAYRTPEDYPDRGRKGLDSLPVDLAEHSLKLPVYLAVQDVRCNRRSFPGDQTWPPSLQGG